MITHQVRILDLMRRQRGNQMMQPRCICGWFLRATTARAAERHKASHLEWAYEQIEEGSMTCQGAQL